MTSDLRRLAERKLSALRLTTRQSPINSPGEYPRDLPRSQLRSRYSANPRFEGRRESGSARGILRRARRRRPAGIGKVGGKEPSTTFDLEWALDVTDPFVVRLAARSNVKHTTPWTVAEANRASCATKALACDPCVRLWLGGPPFTVPVVTRQPRRCRVFSWSASSHRSSPKARWEIPSAARNPVRRRRSAPALLPRLLRVRGRFSGENARHSAAGRANWRVITKRQPTEGRVRWDLRSHGARWAAGRKFVSPCLNAPRSGIGARQMSRVDAWGVSGAQG